MADDGFGVAVLVLGVAVVQALVKKIPKASLAHIVQAALRQVAAQGIHCNLQNQPWGLLRCSRSGAGRYPGQAKYGQEFAHRESQKGHESDSSLYWCLRF